MQLSSHPSAAQLAVEATAVGYTLVALNYGQPGITYVVFPQSGPVQLCYGYATQPAQQVYIAHQGGGTTPVTAGCANYSVNQGDLIVAILGDPSLSIKLQYTYL